MPDLGAQVEHGYVDAAGVRLHYALLGDGPLMLLIHGFPDFWFTWRHQIPALAKDYRVVAFDLRGYDLSDEPARRLRCESTGWRRRCRYPTF